MSYASDTKRILRQEDITAYAQSSTDVMDIFESCTLIRLGILITTAANTAITTSVVTLEAYPGATGGTAIDSVLVPTAGAIGEIYYVDVTPTALVPGDQLLWTHSASGSTVRGQCFAVVIPKAEIPGNESDMVESA